MCALRRIITTYVLMFVCWLVKNVFQGQTCCKGIPPKSYMLYILIHIFYHIGQIHQSRSIYLAISLCYETELNWVKTGAKAPISTRHRGTTVSWSFSASVGRTDFFSTTSLILRQTMEQLGCPISDKSLLQRIECFNLMQPKWGSQNLETCWLILLKVNRRLSHATSRLLD